MAIAYTSLNVSTRRDASLPSSFTSHLLTTLSLIHSKAKLQKQHSSDFKANQQSDDKLTSIAAFIETKLYSRGLISENCSEDIIKSGFIQLMKEIEKGKAMKDILNPLNSKLNQLKKIVPKETFLQICKCASTIYRLRIRHTSCQRCKHATCTPFKLSDGKAPMAVQQIFFRSELMNVLERGMLDDFIKISWDVLLEQSTDSIQKYEEWSRSENEP